MPNAEPVRFDLSTGQVATPKGERLLMVPLASLDELATTLGEKVAAGLARSVGVAMGRRIAERLGSIDGVRAASLEDFVSELAAEASGAGWGTISFERWGRALVVVADHVPSKVRDVAAALVEGAIEAAAGREVHGVALAPSSSGDTGAVRVLVLGAKAAENARLWTAEGLGAVEVIGRLQAPKGGTP